MAATEVINPAVLNALAPAPILAPVPAPVLAPVPAPVLATVPAAASAPAAAEPVETGRHTDPLNYTKYVRDISKELHPEMNISADIITAVNQLLVDVAKSVIRTADAMAAADKTLTLNLKEIKAAIPGILPASLIDHVLGFADSAVQKYDAKLLDGVKRRRSNSPRDAAAPATPAAAAPASPAPAAPVAAAVPAPAKPKVARSTRAGLTIPISRVEAMIRMLSATKRVGAGGPVYLAAVLDFLAQDLLEATAYQTEADRIRTLKLRHLVAALCHDPELRRLFGYWVVDQQLLAAAQPATPAAAAPAPTS